MFRENIRKIVQELCEGIKALAGFKRTFKKQNKMKKILYVAIVLFAASCSESNDLQETFGNIVETGAITALDSLQNVANEELQRHTGVDSMATRLRAADTIDVEREVKRELLKQLSE